MPLLDHFHPPVSERRSWEGFHGLWAAALVEKLNRDVLAEEYYADMQVHVGSQVEVDVATLKESAGNGKPDGATTLAPAWAPPTTDLVFPTVFPDDIEVQVFGTVTGATLVAAIELVSPGNKDRAAKRRLFAAKCATYLSRGVGLIVVDVVTSRHANMHNEMVNFLLPGGAYAFPDDVFLYAVAYRPARPQETNLIEAWPTPLAVGGALPVAPLALRGHRTVPLDLDATYTEARQRSRL